MSKKILILILAPLILLLTFSVVMLIWLKEAPLSLLITTIICVTLATGSTTVLLILSHKTILKLLESPVVPKEHPIPTEEEKNIVLFKEKVNALLQLADKTKTTHDGSKITMIPDDIRQYIKTNFPNI